MLQYSYLIFSSVVSFRKCFGKLFFFIVKPWTAWFFLLDWARIKSIRWALFWLLLGWIICRILYMSFGQINLTEQICWSGMHISCKKGNLVCSSPLFSLPLCSSFSYFCVASCSWFLPLILTNNYMHQENLFILFAFTIQWMIFKLGCTSRICFVYTVFVFRSFF